MSPEPQDVTAPKEPIYSVTVDGPEGQQLFSVTGTYSTVMDVALRAALDNTEWKGYLAFTYMIRVVKVTK
jgi:hypothetical protein